jgi:hypothetical protein
MLVRVSGNEDRIHCLYKMVQLIWQNTLEVPQKLIIHLLYDSLPLGIINVNSFILTCISMRIKTYGHIKT